MAKENVEGETLMEKFFKLKENNTKVSTEILAGLTTFFAMAYILFVNPAMLSQTGRPVGGEGLAWSIDSCAATGVRGGLADVRYAQAPGNPLSTFFA